jgi:hypothetical protein
MAHSRPRSPDAARSMCQRSVCCLRWRGAASRWAIALVSALASRPRRAQHRAARAAPRHWSDIRWTDRAYTYPPTRGSRALAPPGKRTTGRWGPAPNCDDHDGCDRLAVFASGRASLSATAVERRPSGEVYLRTAVHVNRSLLLSAQAGGYSKLAQYVPDHRPPSPDHKTGEWLPKPQRPRSIAGRLHCAGLHPAGGFSRRGVLAIRPVLLASFFLTCRTQADAGSQTSLTRPIRSSPEQDHRE